MLYAQPLQTALDCVTPARLRYRRSEPEVDGVLDFEHAPIRLRRTNQDSGERLDPVYLIVVHRYRVSHASDDVGSQGYVVVPSGYAYTISGHNHREVIAFHWHPGQRSHEHDPHIHIGSVVIDPDSIDFGREFSRLHIPTGQVSLARVVRMLLTDFQVMPNRQDWDVVLGRLVGSET